MKCSSAKEVSLKFSPKSLGLKYVDLFFLRECLDVLVDLSDFLSF